MKMLGVATLTRKENGRMNGTVNDQLATLDALLNGTYKPEETAGQSAGTEADGGGQESEGTESDDDEVDDEADPDADPEAKPDEKPAPPQVDKNAAAFAKMRTENAKLAKSIDSLAKSLNIEGTLEEKLEKINAIALTKTAADSKLPVEILQRMNSLEEENESRRIEQNSNMFLENLTKMYTTKGMTREQLTEFAEHLDDTGVTQLYFSDPSKVDLDYIYFKKYGAQSTESLIQAAVEKALREQAADAGSATTPPKKSGKGGDPTPAKINTVGALGDFLNSAGK
jgi:hypothetical protein